ncbi:MAG: hypothetical protein GX950_01805 [Candidatus Diapherotrites archaeon]|uniref:Cation/H+ exchanger transmembrane domain-containing protein n=1 Tax=Candidatus Iainarchaeum sp. TaxID=3101447 RepID=A0A7K4BZ73_9ARCH|nr:hypothetical protein [Candidatus Diapherotrites archaeon]
MGALEITFFAIGCIIFIGYLGMIFFNKTKIPEIILLLVIGLIIGPIAGIVDPQGIAFFESILPFFATFALMIILFEGGLHLNFFKIIKAISGSFIFTIIVFILSVVFCTGITLGLSSLGLLHFDLLTSIMFGAILGGTSSAIVIPLVNSISTQEETKTLLSLESALTDALSVITVVAIGELIILQTIDLTNVTSSILAAFSIAAVVGGLFGLLWLRVLSFLEKKPYEYLMTLAALMLLYSIIATFKGNGAIAALTFGLVLGNSEEITSMLKITTRKVEGSIKNFQKEISFLVRTLFFVYLGILFKFEYLTIQVIGATILIVVFLYIARVIGTKIISKIKPVFKEDKKIISTMLARGLAAAVLVSIPVSMNLGLEQALLDEFTAIAFLVIFLTNIVTTIGVFISEKENKTKKKKTPGQKLIVTE